MKSTKQTRAINKINLANELLKAALFSIQELNKEDQFDYVNSPRLSEATDEALNTINKIEKIVYQKVK